MSKYLPTIARKVAYAVSLMAIVLLAAEMGTRVEDWIYYRHDLWANPTFDGNMLVRETYGGHGKPNGRYKRWKLNSFGFRGPEISRGPSSGTVRILVLGASETFGINESDNKEFPAQLCAMLRREGKYEVINAALPGMGLSGMVSYWENWASQFHPSLVVIYPNSLFYLCDPPPKRPREMRTPASPASANRLPGSRFLDQMKDIVHLPDCVQQWRLDRKIAQQRAQKPKTWYFHTVPQERLNLFMDDLALLVDSIRHAGAEPILVTQALSASSMDDPDHLHDLHAWLVNVPQSNEQIILGFAQQANKKVIEFGREQGIPVFDVAADLSGKREKFSDLVHFRDGGAEDVARALARGIHHTFADIFENHIATKTIKIGKSEN